MTIATRINTFESHELEWVPIEIKNLFREILSWEQDMLGVYSAAAPLVREWLSATGATGILDLCSGAGGPGTTLTEALNGQVGKKIRMKLTDLYPATASYEKIVQLHPDTMTFAADRFDATDSHVQADFPVRTLLSSFHHFSPVFARKILADAARNSDGICIMDPFQRDWFHLLSVPLGATAGTVIYPALKKNTALAFAACNLSPLMAAMFFWDSIASVLRGYTTDELMQLTRDPSCGSFRWEAGTWQYPAAISGFGMTGVYLLGVRR
jgi:hypothetical protein